MYLEYMGYIEYNARITELMEKGEKKISKVRTRIAPSPTGHPHIGTIYQALFDYAFAKKYGGDFVVRIEDTDRTRFMDGAEDEILNALDWFNLYPDESPNKPNEEYAPYRQSERKEAGIYDKFIYGGEYKGIVYDGLLNMPLPEYRGHSIETDDRSKYCAYYCFCTKERLDELRAKQQANKEVPRYDKHCLSLSREEIEEKKKNLEYVIRLNVPNDYVIKFDDWLVGEIEISSKDIDDQVLLKSDGFPTYHLAVVVDDYLMNISHVFRGREWLPSAPKHILLYYYFQWERPTFIHLPVILNMDGKGKLSKRHGHASVSYYQDSGFLPEAILNYLSNIVWNHPEEKEIYSIEEFQKAFFTNKIQGVKTIHWNTDLGLKEIISKSDSTDNKIYTSSQGPRFDLDKLLWVNQQWIMRIANNDINDLIERLKKFYEKDKDVLDVLDNNFLIVGLASTRMKTLRDFKELLMEPVVKPRNNDENKIAVLLKDKLENISQENWKKEEIFSSLKEVMQEKNIKMPILYYVFTGKERGLPLPETLEGLGKERTLERLDLFMK